MSWEATTKHIAIAVFGVAIAGAGGFFLWRYMQPPTVIDRHIVYAFSAWIAVGCTLIAPGAILGAFKQIAALLPQIKIGSDKP